MQTSYHVYQLFFQPQFGYSCKFHPSCSCYAKQAFHFHSFPKALFLTLWRVLRCHPFSRGGVDPLPPKVVEPYGR